MKYTITLLLGLAVSVYTAPADVDGHVSASGSLSTSGNIPPPVSFENGNVNVNFAGFKASAGLGGLVTGNAAHGGLQASAETPFGQRAAAGLGGVADGNGGLTSGGLYAGATAGGNVGASASLDGSAGSSGSLVGTRTVAASAGNAGVYKSITSHGSPVESDVTIEKHVEPETRYDVHKEVAYQPAVTVTETKPETVQRYEIHKEIRYQPQVVKTVTQQVVPQTVVTKQVVTQPAQTVYFKTRFRSHPRRWHKYFTFNSGFDANSNAKNFVTVPPTQHVEQKQEVHTVSEVVAPPRHTQIVKEYRYEPIPPPRKVTIHKHVHYGPPPPPFPFFGQFSATGVAGAHADAGAAAGGEVDVSDDHVASVITPRQEAVATKSGSTNFHYSSNVRGGNVINDIFNIPIQTLSAVNRLVGGIVGGTSVSVDKHVSVY